MLPEIELQLAPQPPVASFEQLEATISGEASWYAEGDGSFSLAAPDAVPPWHLYGMMYDDGPGLIRRVELKGSCPLSIFEKILAVVSQGSQCEVFNSRSGQALNVDEAKGLWDGR